MSKTRFTPWIVLACIGTLAGCTSGEGDTAGNTELNVVIPSGSSQSGPGTAPPGSFDIQVVEYTIACNDGIDFDPTSDPEIDSGPTLDNDVKLSGVLEVLDTASAGVSNQDFGPDLDEVYVWQAFMDLPPTAGCTVQLRARDGDGEVICTRTETFDISADNTTKVNVLMYCDISYQAPVGMLDLDGDFSFNVSNYCPDLFVLNCIDSELNVRSIPGIGEVLVTACQVRFRDADGTCGDSCDPQTCGETPTGLSCTPGPDPGNPTTVVTCTSNSGTCAISCDGFNPAASCPFTGNTLGNTGDPAPGPLQPGQGGFFVSCATFDDDADPTTPEVPVAPGDDIVCTAVTTDGDLDCDKTKEVDLTIVGLTNCGIFGGDAACQASSSTVCLVGTCNDGTCDGSTPAACCDFADATNGSDCSAENGGLAASCQGGVCVAEDCNAVGCEDSNDCTQPQTCNVGTGACEPAPPVNEADSTVCDVAFGSGAADGVCDGGTCTTFVCNDAADCDDSNQCTDDACDTTTPAGVCSNTIDATNTCNTCADTPNCECNTSGACVDAGQAPPPVDAIGIGMACRNTFNQAVSTFPIDLENVTADVPIEAGQPVNFAIDPTIALDTAFLQAAADTLCATGLALTEADVGLAQISIDAVAGATCTEQLTELTPVPQTVTLDVTIVGTCGSGGTITVNSGIALALPAVTLPCTAGAAGSEVQICSTGEVPLFIDLGTPDNNETYVNVVVGGGFITVAFKCNTSSTTEPAPGVTVSCTAPNPTGECAGIPAGDTGEQPFPVSDCDFGDGFPGDCTTVPRAVDPSTACATFPVL